MLGIQRAVIAFALLAFLVAGGLGAHVHLCFDGQEPPSSVHVMETGSGVHHDRLQDHKDVDVAPTDQMLVKVSKLDVLMTVLVVIALFFFASTAFLLPHARETLRRFRPPRFLLPPLRAPPV